MDKDLLKMFVGLTDFLPKNDIPSMLDYIHYNPNEKWLIASDRMIMAIIRKPLGDNEMFINKDDVALIKSGVDNVLSLTESKSDDLRYPVFHLPECTEDSSYTKHIISMPNWKKLRLLGQLTSDAAGTFTHDKMTIDDVGLTVELDLQFSYSDRPVKLDLLKLYRCFNFFNKIGKFNGGCVVKISSNPTMPIILTFENKYGDDVHCVLTTLPIINEDENQY